jgi:hypothetical protein
MNFLTFFDECVVLGYSKQRELVHEVDFMRLVHVLPLRSIVGMG